MRSSTHTTEARATQTKPAPAGPRDQEKPGQPRRRTVGTQTDSLPSALVPPPPVPPRVLGRRRGIRLRGALLPEERVLPIGHVIDPPRTRRSPERRDRRDRPPRYAESDAVEPRRSRSPRSESPPFLRREPSRTPPSSRPQRPSTASPRDASWNCRSSDHVYSECTQPRDRPYCYGCGREGVTIRTCPDCGPEWRDLGPYRPGRDHMGRRA